MKKLKAIFIAAVAMGSLILAPNTAEAGPVGGTIYNGSDHGMWIVKNYPRATCNYCGFYGLITNDLLWLPAGKVSSNYIADADGFFTGQGWCTRITKWGTNQVIITWRGPATVKVPDIPAVELYEYHC